jgi:predicted RNA-binding protein YlqC (UPF0109 family)
MSADGITNVESWHSSLYRVMAAQVLNLQRIIPGEEIGSGVIRGVRPDVIRLHDTPDRIKARPGFEEKRLIVTVGPLNDQSDGGRIVHRDGRIVQYLIVALMALTREEQERDSREMGVDSLLARRCDAFIHDLKLVFKDNFHLSYPGCASGLVDDHEMDVTWDPEAEYPMALAVVKCVGQLYELDE